MEVDNQSPSEINSYPVNDVLKTDIVELSKKRKLQDEHFGLPSPKHICCDNASFPSKAPYVSPDGSETESGKGSNSFAEDAEYSVSSSANWGPSISDGNYDSADSTTIMKDEVSSLADDYGDKRKSVAEYQNHLELIYSEYGMQNMEHYTDKEILYSSNDMDDNTNTFVLSSGRWSVNRESQQGARKPTIDEEFEQYFSMLML